MSTPVFYKGVPPQDVEPSAQKFARDEINRALDFQQPPGIVFRGIIDSSIWRGSQMWARWVDNNPGRENITISTVSISRSCLFFSIYAMVYCCSLHGLLQLPDCQ